MLSLEPDHITDLYVFVDDMTPIVREETRGRNALLSNSELITILVWNSLTVRQKTLKDIHNWLLMYHSYDFPQIPKYNAFIEHCHKIIPYLASLLRQLFSKDAPIKFMDSTMLPVCKVVRANSHKVAKDIAEFGKNHQGWHYGFKLHASVDHKRRLCAIAFTPANIHDAQMMPKILNKNTQIGVGDGGYTASVMNKKIWEGYGCVTISPPHPKQRKKLMNWWQDFLLKVRPKVESAFDYLKEHLHLVTSFPRSIKGYFLHYLRILLGYQFITLS